MSRSTIRHEHRAAPGLRRRAAGTAAGIVILLGALAVASPATAGADVSTRARAASRSPRGQCELQNLVQLFANASTGSAAQFRIREEMDRLLYF